MKVFLAGATGVNGRRLVMLLRQQHIDIVGTTRTPAKGRALNTLGAKPVVVDVFDADAIRNAVEAAEPDIVVHQLTDLTAAPGSPDYQAALERNSRLRIEGTRNLVAAAKAAGVTRMIAQSIAFAYVPGSGTRIESDAIDPAAKGVIALEEAVTKTPGLDGVVLRYGYLHGPGSWYDAAPKPPSLHVDAAAQAALLAIQKAKPGFYNIAEDSDVVSIEKAKRELGFDAAFRMK
jgi:nucleoside-diphosphate-sugar epimerase